MQERQNKRNIRVTPRYRYDINIVDTYPYESNIFISKDWLKRPFIQFKNFALESFSDSWIHVSSVVPGDNNLSFLI